MCISDRLAHIDKKHVIKFLKNDCVKIVNIVNEL